MPAGHFLRSLAVLLACTLCAVPVREASAGIDVASLETSVAPCRDFYDYVNGKWLKSAQIPDDRARWGAFSELDKRNEELVQAILDKAIDDPSIAPGSAVQKAVDYYASGIDSAAVERGALGALQPELERIEAIASRGGLADALAALHAAGVSAGFSFGVVQDVKRSSRYIVELSQGGLGLPERDYYFRTDARSKAIRKAYSEHVRRMFELLGEPPAVARRGAATVIAMETRLAKASRRPAELRDPSANYHLLRLASLAEAAPGLAWPRYFAAAGLPQPGEFNVGQPAFFKALAGAVQSVPLADWKTYLRWHLLRMAASKLPQRFENEQFRFYGAVLEGRKRQRPRPQRVLETIDGHYGEAPVAQAVGELYVAHAFPPEAKAQALALVENIKSALGDRLRAIDWMSEPTRERALAKLAAMSVKIGYPDRPRDYSRLTIDRRSYLANWLAANRFEHERLLHKLGQPVDRHEWWMSPQTVNAYYNPSLNEIVFPAAILQPPFFDPKADPAVNYGAIGMVIGHEITHGFDDQGRKFDAEGNLRDWWGPEDAQRYQARATVIERQYGAYQVSGGLHLDGKLTMGENIADLGGLKIAWLALHKALQAQGDPGPIDGLTQEQRFFVSFAGIWRDKTRPERERVDVTSDPHSPPRFRVMGVLANMPEFAQAFACQSEDTALRPESERVRIW